MSFDSVAPRSLLSDRSFPQQPTATAPDAAAVGDGTEDEDDRSLKAGVVEQPVVRPTSEHLPAQLRERGWVTYYGEDNCNRLFGTPQSQALRDALFQFRAPVVIRSEDRKCTNIPGTLAREASTPANQLQ